MAHASQGVVQRQVNVPAACGVMTKVVVLGLLADPAGMAASTPAPERSRCVACRRSCGPSRPPVRRPASERSPVRTHPRLLPGPAPSPRGAADEHPASAAASAPPAAVTTVSAPVTATAPPLLHRWVTLPRYPTLAGAWRLSKVPGRVGPLEPGHQKLTAGPAGAHPDRGHPLGELVDPRPRTATENRTWHNYDVVPTASRYVLVAAQHQGGISVVYSTDPAKAKEIAADGAPRCRTPTSSWAATGPTPGTTAALRRYGVTTGQAAAPVVVQSILPWTVGLIGDWAVT